VPTAVPDKKKKSEWPKKRKRPKKSVKEKIILKTSFKPVSWFAEDILY